MSKPRKITLAEKLAKHGQGRPCYNCLKVHGKHKLTANLSKCCDSCLKEKERK